MKKTLTLTAMLLFSNLVATELSTDISKYVSCVVADFAFKTTDEDKKDADFTMFAFNSSVHGDQMILTQNNEGKCNSLQKKAYSSYLADTSIINKMDTTLFQQTLEKTAHVYWGMLNGIWLSKKQEKRFLFSDEHSDEIVKKQKQEPTK